MATRPTPRHRPRARRHDVAHRSTRRTKLFNRICAGVLIAFALLWLVPLAWALDTSLKPNAETTRTTWLIDNPTFDAFGRILRDTDILQLVRRQLHHLDA